MPLLLYYILDEEGVDPSWNQSEKKGGIVKICGRSFFLLAMDPIEWKGVGEGRVMEKDRAEDGRVLEAWWR